MTYAVVAILLAVFAVGPSWLKMIAGTGMVAFLGMFILAPNAAYEEPVPINVENVEFTDISIEDVSYEVAATIINRSPKKIEEVSIAVVVQECVQTDCERVGVEPRKLTKFRGLDAGHVGRFYSEVVTTALPNKPTRPGGTLSVAYYVTGYK